MASTRGDQTNNKFSERLEVETGRAFGIQTFDSNTKQKFQSRTQ